MDSRDESSIATLGKAFGILMEFSVGTLVFIGIGWLLDNWLGTDPWLVIVGVVFGFGGGTYRMIRQVKALGGESGGERSDRGEGGQGG